MANVTLIPEDYDALKKEYLILRRELDSVNQELYGCKRQLKVVEALQHEYQSEIELLQSEDDIKTQKLEEKIRHLEEAISNIRSKHNETVQNLEVELSNKDEVNESLKAEIELLKKTNNVQAPSEDANKLIEEIVELKQENEALIETEEELKLSLEIVQKNNFSLEETLLECREELTFVKESLSCKRHELCEANDLVQKLNDELFCLKSELMSYKSKPLNEESKGNSLFAEVDDRRVYLQKTINSMKKEYIFMKQERARHLNTISHLKTENKSLCDRWKTDMEEKEEDQYMIMKAYKDRIQILENLIEKYKKDVSAKPLVITTGTFNEIEFYQIMLNNKVKEAEELRDQLASRGLTQTILSTSLKEANKELRKWRLEATLRQCQLQLKLGECTLESKMTEKLGEELEDRRIELKQTKKGPKLACKKEEKEIESNAKEQVTNMLSLSVKKEEAIISEQKVITINDSGDDIQIIHSSEDIKQENVSVGGQEEEKMENSNLSTHIGLSDLDSKENVTRTLETAYVKEATGHSDVGSGDIQEEKENIPESEEILSKPMRKVTFSQNTVSPKATDRTAIRTNCIRVAIPKPIYIPSE